MPRNDNKLNARQGLNQYECAPGATASVDNVIAVYNWLNEYAAGADCDGGEFILVSGNAAVYLDRGDPSQPPALTSWYVLDFLDPPGFLMINFI